MKARKSSENSREKKQKQQGNKRRVGPGGKTERWEKRRKAKGKKCKEVGRRVRVRSWDGSKKM